MKVQTLITLIAATLIAGASLADQDKPGAEASKAKETTTQAKAKPASKPAAKPAPAPVPALVDINTASKDELVAKLGVKADVADRIIAARPYGSKAQLITRNVLPESAYLAIKSSIIAKQRFKDAGKNAALQKKK